jgi:hypothetical protein
MGTQPTLVGHSGEWGVFLSPFPLAGPATPVAPSRFLGWGAKAFSEASVR